MRQRESEKIPSEGLRVEGSSACLTACVCVCVFRGSPMEGGSASMLWACVSLAKVSVRKNHCGE